LAVLGSLNAAPEIQRAHCKNGKTNSKTIRRLRTLGFSNRATPRAKEKRRLSTTRERPWGVMAFSVMIKKPMMKAPTVVDRTLSH
jgi:hypothetical protein